MHRIRADSRKPSELGSVEDVVAWHVPRVFVDKSAGCQSVESGLTSYRDESNAEHDIWYNAHRRV